MPGPGFAVIDFETTGLFPGGHDRVVEVAVVHLDSDGRITGQWDTLVNPGRDLGPQHIHRIRACDVLGAPTFAQIAPRLVELLSGRLIVAHNASFDTRFLLAELERAGYTPELNLQALCTMQLAREFLPGSGRSLEDCCAAYGIELVGAHRASVDAVATAQLLAAYISHSPMWIGWSDNAARANAELPPFIGNTLPWQPRDTEPADPKTFLQRITIKMPEHSGPAEHLDYLALLDRCLIDRVLSAHEANALVDLAESVGISRATCEELHRQYFDDLTAIAWADGELSLAEIADLVAVAQLFDIPTETVAAAMQPPAQPLVAPARPEFRLEPGDLIVLTGEMSRPREEWHAHLRERGFVPWEAVTKKVKLLVAADPDSLSGKARKARDYNIAVICEQHLMKLVRA